MQSRSVGKDRRHVGIVLQQPARICAIILRLIGTAAIAEPRVDAMEAAEGHGGGCEEEEQAAGSCARQGRYTVDCGECEFADF